MTATAVPDVYRLIQDTPFTASSSGVLANDQIASGNGLTVVSNTAPAHGTIALNANGTFTFTPTSGYTGPDAFNYTATDGQGNNATSTVSLTVVASQVDAGVLAGSRLASVNTTQSALLNGVLGGLLGTNLTLNVVDWNALASGNVGAAPVVNALQTNLGLASPAAALNANATLAQIFGASATAAQAQGNTALANAFNALGVQVGGLTGTVKLGDLLNVNANDGSLAESTLNALDLVTGNVQLFNFNNVLTTPAPVTVSGSALGLQSVLNSVQLSAQVVEPPVYVRGGVGTQFHTAAIRLKLNLDIVDLNPNTSALVAALGSLGLVTANVSLGQLELYVDVASGSGTLTSINAIGQAVTLQGTPGVANAYLGSISDTVFSNRTRAIVPATDLSFGNVGTLGLRVAVPITGIVLADVSAGIQIKSAALGQAPLANSLTYNAPFPKTQTIGSSASFLSNLLSSLTSNLQIQLNGSLGALLNPLVNGTILPVLKPIVSGAISPVLGTVLTSVVDPALRSVGVGIGELVATVDGIGVQSAPLANNDFTSTAEDTPTTILVLGDDAFVAGDTVSVTSVVQPAHGSVVINPNGTILYTPAANYNGSDTFTYSISNGGGTSSTATVTVQVTPVADAPVAVADSYAATEDTPLVVAAPGVLANDTDADGNTLTAAVVTGPAHGSLTFNANSSFTYTPAANYNGPDSFTYRASDGALFSAPVTVNLTVAAVNDPPVAVADTYTATEDTALVVAAPGVLANDTDVDGNPLTASLVSGPLHGTLTLNANGSFTYTPVANYNGPDSFSYRASDGSAFSAPTTVSLTVTAVADAPVALADAYAAIEDTPLVVTAPGVLANDTDGDGDPLTAAVVTGPAHGSLTLNPNGSFTYTPAANYNGPDSFTYRASDGTLFSTPVTVTLTVAAVNDTPVSVADSYAATEDTPLVVAAPGVLANDTDADGDPLTAVLVSGPAHGSLILNANGSFTYTPAANYNGADSFVYRASDGTTQGAPTTVSLTVAAVNDAPVALADSYSATEDTPLVVTAPGVLANDTDVDGNPLTAVLVTGPTNGTLILNANGSFTYTPNANFNGADSFTYRASDGTALSAPVSVSLAVGAVNDAPVAVADTYAATEDTPLVVAGPGVLGNDTDVDGDTLSAILVTGPAHGTLTLNANGSFTYTPAANYNGADSFSYRASDGTAQSAPVTVSLTVAAVADAPVAAPDAYAATEDTPLVVAAPGVLANDTDGDGDPLTAALVTGPAHGTLTLNANGSFTYTPAANYNGADSFTYRASDGTLFSAPVTVNFSVAAVNDAPVAVADSYAATEDAPLVVAGPGVLANDTDADGNTLTAAVVTGPAHGSLTLNADGSFTYTPVANYNGADSFTYRASDGTLFSAPVTVSLTVAAVNDAPVAAPDTYAATEDTPLVVAAPGVLANDTDVDGNPLTAAVVAGPTNGTLVLAPNGSFTYTPNANYNGVDSFTYQASDGTLLSAPVTVSLTVAAVNDAPVAVADSYAATEDTPLTVAGPGVLANDTDADGNTLTAAVGTGPAHGSLTLNADGSFTYTPAANYNGADSFTYRASDGTLFSAPVTVTLNVAAVNDAPVAAPDTYAATEDTPLVVAAPGLLANDTDVDGDPLTAALVTGPAHGSLVLNANGSFTYTPTANYNGADSFTYRISDGTLFSAPVTVSLTVAAVNDAPVAVADTYAATEDTPLTVAGPGVLSNDTDADGNTLTAAVVTGPAHGALTLNPDGSFTYTPAANFNGTDSFTYRASDGTLFSAPVTVTLNVAAVNDAPVAAADAYAATEDTPLVVAAPGVLANDTDVDGNPLTAAVVAGPTNGTLALNPDGSFLYTPNANFNGVDSFTYQASDGSAQSATVTVTLTVAAVNDAPVAGADTYTTTEDTSLVVAAPGVLGNDTDAEGSTLTASVLAGPAHGSLTLNANGSFTYTPVANYNGADSFTYRAFDGTLFSAPVTVNLSVTAVNDAPVALADSYATAVNTPLVVAAVSGVLANDTDVDGGPLIAVLGTNPTDGTLALNPDGSFTYTPNAAFNGVDSFTYQVSDGTLLSAPVTVTLAVGTANSAPIALADAYIATEDTPLVVAGPGVLFNDTDAQGDTLSAILVTSPTHGTLALNSDGSFTYTPNANYNGPDSFTYQAKDAVLLSAPVTVTLTVTAVNDAPVALADTYAATEDTALTVTLPGVLANDTDVDGNPLTAILGTGPANGTLVLNPDGSFLYTPNANFNGVDSFTYQATDGTTPSGLVTVTLNVAAVNDAPVAVADTFTATEDTPLVVAAVSGVLANDTDVDSGTLTAVLVTGPSNGTLTFNPNGSFTYTPNANYNGSDSFTYRASDGTLFSAPVTVTLTVTAVNDAPVAGADSYAATEDTPLVITAPGVLANDTDAEGDTLLATLVAGPTHGTLALNPDGSFTYTPNANYNGPDSFTYQATDGTTPSATVTVSFSVAAVNDAPVAVADTYSATEDTPLVVAAVSGVLANDTDVDSGTLTAVLVSGPTNGTLTFNPNGSFTYTPNANYNGSDSFTYRASDGTLFSAPVTVTLTVTAVNDAPVAGADSYAATEDTPLVITAPGVLANDTDAEGDTLLATLVAGPTHGTLALNPDGSFTYTPNANYNGPDSFTYQATDGTTPSATVTVSFSVAAVNDAPVAVADAYSATEDTPLVVAAGAGLLANDTDVDGNPLSAFLVTGPTHGTLAVNPDGSFTYTPASNYNGADSFSYRVSDGTLFSAPVTVNLSVTAVNDAPVAVADSYLATEDTPLVVAAGLGVLANDTDAEGSTLTASVVSGPAHGVLVLNANGSFTYTPAANYNGPDSFTYQASDGSTPSASVTVTFAVAAVDDAPVAVADTYAAVEDTPLVVAAGLGVLANDTDVENDPLTAVLVTGPAHGTLTLGTDGSFTYTPNANFNGPDSFTYQANDGSTLGAPVTVNLSVTAINDTPAAVADSYAATEDTPLVVTVPGVLANDTDADGTPLTAVLVTGPAHGTLTLNANGSFTYTPAANYNGSDSFTYRASDGTAQSAPVTVSFAVAAVNDAPVALADSYAATEDTPLVVAGPGVLANDTDVEGDPLSAILVTGPTHGTLALNANGSFTYTPAANYNGADSFTYRASDGTLFSAPVTVSLTVAAVNDAPVAGADSFAAIEDTPLVVAAPGVLANDTDAEGSTLTPSVLAGPAHGSLTLNANGSFTYTPVANYNGADSFTYRVFDGTLFSAPVTVTLNVASVNDTPASAADSYAATEDTPLVVAAPGVLANDTDADGDPLTALLVTGPAHGTLVLNPNGSFTYTPLANYNGVDSFIYQASDGTSLGALTTVSLNVAAVNDVPVAGADSYAATEDTPLVVTAPGVLANDTDADGTPLTAVLVTGPAHGTLTLNPNGSFTYTPAANYNGSDSFVYQATDGTTPSASVTVTFAVAAVNDAPVALADSYAATEDTPLVVAGPGVLANDTDAEGDSLSVILVTGPTHGTLALNANGSFTYTPAANYNGADSFTYRASDGTAQSAPVTVSFAVAAVNDAPVALPDSYAATEDTPLVVAGPGVLANDVDADGTPLTAVLVTGPTNGTLVLSPNGSFTYTPNANYNGVDSFTYQASDGTAFSAPVTVSFAVGAVNDAPVALADSYAVTEDTPLVVAGPGVLANDTDVEGDPLTAILVTGPTHGTLTLNANGSFTYTPAANYNGSDSFTYQASDGFGTSGLATVTLNVAGVNDAPVALADAYTTKMNAPLVATGLGVLVNDTDVDGDPLTAAVVTGPAHGTLVLNPNGSFTYTPNANYVGPDSFVYQASDGTTTSAPTTVSLTVILNTAPVSLGDSYAAVEDTPLVVASPGVLGNDTDADGDSLTASVVTGPAHGTLVLNPNGSFTYTPASNYNGPDSFVYQASDGTSPGTPVTVSLNVASVNDAPVSQGDSYAATEDTPLVAAGLGVLANDTDADGTPLTAVLVTGPTHGTLVLNPNGSFTYTPNANYNGSDSFVYQASDGTTTGAPTTVTLAVAAVADAPSAGPDTYPTTEDTPLVVAGPGVLANDTDADGDPLTAVLVTGPTHGTLTLNPNGSFTYTPAANYNGSDSFTYRASDGTNLSAPVTVSFAVAAVNDAPVAPPDAYTATEDTPLVVAGPGVLANDTDPDGTPLTAVLVNGPAHGTLVLNPDGSFSYTPVANYNGPDSFIYRPSDGVSLGDPVTISLTVAAVNDAPVSGPVGYQVPGNAPLVVPAPGVLTNTTDVDGDPLTAILVSGPTNGTLVLNPNGSFIYTPAADVSGTDSFSFRASDGNALGAITIVNLAITAVNRPPVAAPDLFGTSKDIPLNVPGPGVLANDSDPNGTPLRARLVRGPASGQVALNPDGSFSYVPNPGFVGIDSFTYRAGDGQLDSPETSVTVNVASPPALATTVDGIITVPGGPNDIVRLRFKWTFRSAAANDEVGFFLVDDATGKLGGLAPGSKEYRALALANPSRQVVFKSGERAGVVREFEFRGGQHIALYLVKGATTAKAIKGRADLFFSQERANLDGLAHARTGDLGNGTSKFAWEDTSKIGDADFNDVVMSVAQIGGVASTGNLATQVGGAAGAAVTARFTLNRKAATARDEIGRFVVDDASGRIGTLRPGDPGYLQAALAQGRQDTLFAPNLKGTKSTSRVVVGQSHFGFYLVANGTSADVLAGKKKTVFFSFDAANPDRLSHIQRTGDTLFAFENQLTKGKRDFKDATVKVDYF